MNTTESDKPVKLTKKALNDFIVWSSTRYNNYLCLGTKKENVDTVYNSILNGFYTDDRGKSDPSKVTFTIECAGGVGENGNGRYWRLPGRKKPGDYKYQIDCGAKTITGLQTQRILQFNSLPSATKER
jgi:hypothetical protein